MMSYKECRFCHGEGCLACEGEHEKAREVLRRHYKPMLAHAETGLQHPRFKDGVYRDCSVCNGKGCASCESENDKDCEQTFKRGHIGPVSLTFQETNGAKKIFS